MHEQKPHVLPYLARFAIPRTAVNSIAGSYSQQTDMWMIDTAHGPRPAIECSTASHELSTKTEVQAESDDELALELSTKTAVQAEQDD